MLAAMSRLGCGRCREVSCFAKGDKLGEGTYGSVYQARDRASGRLVALKRVKLAQSGFDREGMPPTSLREISLLRRLCHPNVVQLLEVAVGGRRVRVYRGNEKNSDSFATQNLFRQSRHSTSAAVGGASAPAPVGGPPPSPRPRTAQPIQPAHPALAPHGCRQSASQLGPSLAPLV